MTKKKRLSLFKGDNGGLRGVRTNKKTVAFEVAFHRTNCTCHTVESTNCRPHPSGAIQRAKNITTLNMVCTLRDS